MMAGTDPQKQLLTLIRDFATEKSQGERRIVGLKKRIQELRSELDLANAELEDTKRLKETAEQDLKGYEVELARNEASIQTLEVRISLIQDEISIAGSDLEALRNEEGAVRDDFIDKMFNLNADIRKFQEKINGAFYENNLIKTSTNNGQELDDTEDAEVRKGLENQIGEIISQTNAVEQEYQAELNIQKQVQVELIDLERKVFLMEAIKKESIELQDLTSQTSEFEEKIASLGEELQRRCICPSCHVDNAMALNEILQASDGN
ncbi:Kinesin-like protein [Actinidia chinensis var. chinensis]|uniref:Kinesin-like protein n=1 Tax=Actinidia chinensis var. chinensis TaxID=1590841 RepID=A0A2R6RK88_ACTCC|nr:Kinesin-like protein [Actinidia chinensis var. chinensis]